MRTGPEPNVLAWLDAQPAEALWLTSVNVAELLFGLTRLPDGARERGLLASFASMLEVDFGGRVLDFDLRAAWSMSPHWPRAMCGTFPTSDWNW